ncbi:hypothetical protein IJJ27_03300 [bacterium]|nr:hypothetical protein [bacterium]MBQ6436560.1 hypothetical protein [bacterium]
MRIKIDYKLKKQLSDVLAYRPKKYLMADLLRAIEIYDKVQARKARQAQA